MKSFVVVLALVAVSVADVSHIAGGRSIDKDAVILKQDEDVRPDGFNYYVETSNGIAAQQTGVLKQVGSEAAIAVEGSNQHTAPDGTTYQLTFIADENGYQPQGAHLPTPPPAEPIPDYIVRAIEYIRSHPPQPETLVKKY